MAPAGLAFRHAVRLPQLYRFRYDAGMRLYIIRHADPDYANKTITAAGHLEARALSERLEREGLDRIYVSPLGRALHTMQYTADRLGMKHTVQEWVQELGGLSVQDGDGRRMAAWNVPGEEVRMPPLPTGGDWHSTQPFDGPEFGAMFERLQADSDRFLAAHGYERQGGRYRVVSPNRERIAVFCHAGFGLTWLAHLLDLPVPLVWTGFFLPPSSVTTVLFDERSPNWATPRCLGVGDTSHLYAAGLPIQPSGIVANYH